MKISAQPCVWVPAMGLGGGVCIRIRSLLADQPIDLSSREWLPVPITPHQRPAIRPPLVV